MSVKFTKLKTKEGTIFLGSSHEQQRDHILKNIKHMFLLWQISDSGLYNEAEKAEKYEDLKHVLYSTHGMIDFFLETEEVGEIEFEKSEDIAKWNGE